MRSGGSAGKEVTNPTLSNMKTHLHDSNHEKTRPVKEAGNLMAATTSLAEETLNQARHQLEAGLEEGQEICRDIQRNVYHGVHAVKKVLHENNYQVLAIAAGAGALLGFLVASRCRHNAR